MKDFETTRLSKKGQIVIPEEIRRRLGLKAGSKFIVMGEKDVVILKSIAVPKITEFDEIINQIRAQAKEVGLTQDDISDAISQTREKG